MEIILFGVFWEHMLVQMWPPHTYTAPIIEEAIIQTASKAEIIYFCKLVALARYPRSFSLSNCLIRFFSRESNLPERPRLCSLDFGVFVRWLADLTCMSHYLGWWLITRENYYKDSRTQWISTEFPTYKSPSVQRSSNYYMKKGSPSPTDWLCVNISRYILSSRAFFNYRFINLFIQYVYLYLCLLQDG